MTQRRSTHVPDKLEAYMLQVRHALFELVSASEESAVISVEAIDDIAIDSNGLITAEQIKSTVSNDNPLANRAIPFWKTMYNWCDYIVNEHLTPNNLKLLVVSSCSFTPGSIASAFSAAHSRREAEDALQHAADVLRLPTSGAISAAKDCAPYIQYCLADEHKEIVLAVIQLFEFEVHSGTYDSDLKQKFTEQLIPPEYADSLLLTMLGWVTEQVHSFTKNNQPVFISKKEYNDALRKELRGLNCNTILRAISTCPDDSEKQTEVSRHDTYLKQLEIIDLPENELFAAASDFLRTSAEKTEWANRWLVSDYSFEDYNNALKRNWRLNLREVSILYSKTNSLEQQGQLLYNKCQNAVASILLQGCTVPEFFGAGALHSLANEPANAPQIGWHPDYSDLLKEGKEHERDK